MPSPFPGMDPYLETPDLWPDVHHELISGIRSSLNPLIRPAYVARVELRVYVSGEQERLRPIVPDARIEKTGSAGTTSHEASALAIAEPLPVPVICEEEIEEARVEIKHVESGELVTVIEVLSPSNKIKGSEGRTSFMKKRRETLGSDVNWVEIDLLRAGLPSQPMPHESDYRVLVVKRGHSRGGLWPIDIRQPLPVVGIPLREPDKDVPLDLGAVLNAAYDRAAYDLSINYRTEPEPPLEPAAAKWADGLLRQQGRR